MPQPSAERLGLAQPKAQSLRAMKGEDAARARFWIGQVAEDGFGAGREIFKAPLLGAAGQIIRCAAEISGSLLGKSAERRAVGFRFDDAAEGLVDEERIIRRTLAGR